MFGWGQVIILLTTAWYFRMCSINVISLLFLSLSLLFYWHYHDHTPIDSRNLGIMSDTDLPHTSTPLISQLKN